MPKPQPKKLTTPDDIHPVGTMLPLAHANILLQAGISTIGELKGLGPHGLRKIDSLSTIEKEQIIQECWLRGIFLRRQTTVDPVPDDSHQVEARSEVAERGPVGLHPCVILGLGKFVNESTCRGLTTDMINRTRCMTASCGSPWRTCDRCAEQIGAEMTHHIPATQCADPIAGLCEEHQSDSDFRRPSLESDNSPRQWRTANERGIADRLALMASGHKDPEVTRTIVADFPRVTLRVVVPRSIAQPTTPPKPKEKPMSKMPIIERKLGMVLRVDYGEVKKLKAVGFETIRDLIEQTREAVKGKTGYSDTRMAYIARKLADHGLSFKGETLPAGQPASLQPSSPTSKGATQRRINKPTPLAQFVDGWALRKKLKGEFDIKSMEELKERSAELAGLHIKSRKSIERALERFAGSAKTTPKSQMDPVAPVEVVSAKRRSVAPAIASTASASPIGNHHSLTTVLCGTIDAFLQPILQSTDGIMETRVTNRLEIGGKVCVLSVSLRPDDEEVF